MKKALIAFVTLIFFSSFAFADFYTGNKLLDDLRKDVVNDCIDLCFAEGYVTGVFTAYERLFFKCPGSVTKGQIIDIAKKYLREHPEDRHRDATELLQEAFMDAFPFD